MLRIQTAILLLFSLLVAPVATAARPSANAEIGTALKEQALVGAVWSTVAPDGSIHSHAAGLRDTATGAPMRATDKVLVGSITKAMVATGILRLVSQGTLRLDTPLNELLPDVAIDNRWADSPLRLRHLLDHSSGLDDARLWQVFSLKAQVDVPLRQAVDTKLRLRSRPGTKFSYSNTGYTLLGMVIEKVAGERYETYLDRTLLTPLAMNDSSFGFVSQASDPRLAMGHFENGVSQAAVPFYVRPAAQFTTTADDMALFARFLLSDGSIDGKPFIAPHLMRARGTATETEAARAGLLMGYSLGLSRQDRGGAVGLCHGGDTVGYRSMLCLYPEQRKAFFRSVNADVEGANYRRIDAVLVRTLQIPQFEQAAAPMPYDIADWAGLYVPSPGRFETFAYLDHVLGFVTLSREGERLRLKPLQGPARMLLPVGGRLFRAEDRTAASHVLLFDGDGHRAINSDVQSFQKIEWWRIAPWWMSLAAGVLGLVLILMMGLVRFAVRRRGASEPLFFPFLAVLALAIPVPLFATQSFLSIGDLTPASGTLAVVTAAIPLAAIYGLTRHVRHKIKGWWSWIELVAMIGLLQWSIVLAGWDLLPLMLWT